mmetsp:Transcript_9221/g.24219  ORF Transcript_9221/g.24219 Transcript_9221/m.24219 type:complete len:303 (-) Transcript_9221:177-1085(-)
MFQRISGWSHDKKKAHNSRRSAVVEHCSSATALRTPSKKSTMRRNEEPAWSMSAQSANFTRIKRRSPTAKETRSRRSSSGSLPSSSGLPKGTRLALVAWSLMAVFASNGSNSLDKRPFRMPRICAWRSKLSRNLKDSSAACIVAATLALSRMAPTPSWRRNCTCAHSKLSVGFLRISAEMEPPRSLRTAVSSPAVEGLVRNASASPWPAGDESADRLPPTGLEMALAHGKAAEEAGDMGASTAVPARASDDRGVAADAIKGVGRFDVCKGHPACKTSPKSGLVPTATEGRLLVWSCWGDPKG